MPATTEFALSAPGDSLVLDHFAAVWGTPVQVLMPQKTTPVTPGPIYIAEFCLSPAGPAVWAYATIGMSRTPMPYPPDWRERRPERRCELMVVSHEQYSEIVADLSVLAAFPFAQNTFFEFGDRIVGGAGNAIVPGSPLGDIIFLGPGTIGQPEELSQLHDEQGRTIDVLCVCPIYDSERRYAAEHGVSDLLDLLIQHDADAADFFREPVV